MPWQQLVADVALEVLPSGLFAYKQVIITVPRQSGKTTLFGATMEHRALMVQRARVWFTQQSGKDAVDWLLNEHVPVLQPLASAFHVRRAAGSEHIKWHATGSLVRPFPPTPSGLHSKISDLVVVDEPWAFDLVRGKQIDQAIVPTQATRPNAQVWKVSTAGDATSTWWLGTVEAGRAAVKAGRDSGLAFFEWTCPDDLDPCQESSWPVYHPAYGRTIGPEAMHAALEILGPDEFARAYGNRWVSTTARVIPADHWRDAADERQGLPNRGEVSLGFDVALDRSDAAIVAAWTDQDGRCRLEVTDWAEGTGWVAARLVELQARWQPRAVSYDSGGPALDVADEAERLGLTLMPLKTKEYVAACAGFLEALTPEKKALRYRPHQALDEAVSAATRRAVGDAWGWGRRTATVSLAALTAATVARWAEDHAPRLGAFKVY
jgi:phage terminase large subunit-like protein